MKTKYLFLVTLVVTALSLTGCTTKEEIQKTKETIEADFGSTIDEVKKSKDSEPLQEDKAKLIYKDNFSGYNVYVMYMFNNDGKLNSQFISFIDKYNTQEEYDERFEILKTALKYVYDEPIMSKDSTCMWKAKDMTVMLKIDKKDASIIYSSDKYK